MKVFDFVSAKKKQAKKTLDEIDKFAKTLCQVADTVGACAHMTAAAADMVKVTASCPEIVKGVKAAGKHYAEEMDKVREATVQILLDSVPESVEEKLSQLTETCGKSFTAMRESWDKLNRVPAKKKKKKKSRAKQSGFYYAQDVWSLAHTYCSATSERFGDLLVAAKKFDDLVTDAELGGRMKSKLEELICMCTELKEDAEFLTTADHEKIDTLVDYLRDLLSEA